MLDERERKLAQTEYELRDKSRTLNMMEYNYTEAKGVLGEKDQRIQELEAALAAQKVRLDKLKQSIDQALTGFSSDDLSVTQKNGKLYLSMSQNLLFTSGSEDIDWRGKQALMQVAEALKTNTDFEVVVEGHTVGSKAIDVRSLYVLVTVTPQGVGALVVRKKKDQVGSGILRKE